MKRKRNILLWLILLALLSAVAIGYAVWNKPHPRAEDLQSVSIDAQQLYDAFSKNEASANKIYLNKVLSVRGTVAEVSRNQDGKPVVLLGTSDPMGGIQCTFRDETSVAIGQAIAIKGFCNGYTMTVLLNDCVKDSAGK